MSVTKVQLVGNVSTGASFDGDVTITDKIIHAGDTDTAIRFPAADTVSVETSGSERLRITSAGLVGIGSNAPATQFAVQNASTSLGVEVDTTSGFASGPTLRGYYRSGTAYTTLGLTGSQVVFGINDVEKAKLDASGRLLLGTSSARSNISRQGTTGITPFTQIETVVNSYSNGISILNNSGSGFGAMLTLGTSYANAIGSNTIGSSGSQVGTISFASNDGTNFVDCAQIKGEIDGTPGSNVMPGRLIFSTTASGAPSPTERMRITSGGYFKASNNATYRNSLSAQHELNQSASDFIGYFVNTNATPLGLTIGHTTDANSTGSPFLNCGAGAALGTLRAEIRSNGGLANYSANNVNLSDRNVKKDISLAADTWDCLKEWEIVNFRYKDQPEDADLNMGVIAQQVAESCPEAVTVFQEAKEATEDKPAEEERLGVKDQQMVWMAIKALQEAQLRIETLEAKVTALEAS